MLVQICQVTELYCLVDDDMTVNIFAKSPPPPSFPKYREEIKLITKKEIVKRPCFCIFPCFLAIFY